MVWEIDLEIHPHVQKEVEPKSSATSVSALGVTCCGLLLLFAWHWLFLKSTKSQMILLGYYQAKISMHCFSVRLLTIPGVHDWPGNSWFPWNLCRASSSLSCKWKNHSHLVTMTTYCPREKLSASSFTSCMEIM